MKTVRKVVVCLLAGPLLLNACRHAPRTAGEDSAGQDAVVAAATYDRLDRPAFNRAAVRLNLPLFWSADGDGDGVVGPGEIVTLRFYPPGPAWVEGGRFTPAFATAYESLVAWGDAPPLPADLDAAERRRRELVIADLDQGRATLVHTDLTDLSEAEKTFVRHMLAVADGIDVLYALQFGLPVVASRVAADAPSRSLFRRNWGPACVAPKTEQEPACTAIPGTKEIPVGVYPAALQEDDAFCAKLAEAPGAQRLMDPFTVVRAAGDGLEAVAITEAWTGEMQAVATRLRAAADALEAEAGEAALRAYLRAAAKAFEDNRWEPADEAWARMNARNSKWYVRVAPDEVYWEPCALKAGFHLTFARINTDSLSWQERLTPVRQEMEDVLAALVGAPYEARTVSFQLPDFIDIVVNAGDDRSPMGATIGQSLPNWGPVANEGRGRTVAMSNLYTDPDSLQSRRAQAASLLSAETLAAWSDDPAPGLLSTILHEAGHNLGPSHDYAVDGKVDTEVFGGPLSSITEELKAQTGALWYLAFLQEKGIITEAQARESYVDSLIWAFGHVSRGMYTAEGRPKAYSQLAAIQIGFLLDEGALRFDPEAPAANGTDIGVFTMDFERMPAAVDALMRAAGGLKARGDRTAAEALVTAYVDSDAVPQALVTERMLRHPKASFVYSVDL